MRLQLLHEHPHCHLRALPPWRQLSRARTSPAPLVRLLPPAGPGCNARPHRRRSSRGGTRRAYCRDNEAYSMDGFWRIPVNWTMFYPCEGARARMSPPARRPTECSELGRRAFRPSGTSSKGTVCAHDN